MHKNIILLFTITCISCLFTKVTDIYADEGDMEIHDFVIDGKTKNNQGHENTMYKETPDLFLENRTNKANKNQKEDTKFISKVSSYNFDGKTQSRSEIKVAKNLSFNPKESENDTEESTKYKSDNFTWLTICLISLGLILMLWVGIVLGKKYSKYFLREKI